MHYLVVTTLFFCVFWAVAGPLVSPWIEKRLEYFLFGLGLAAVTVSWAWSEAVVLETLVRPMKVCGAILAGSLAFSFSHDNIRAWIRKTLDRIGPKPAVALTVILTGFSACVLTTVVAVLALVEILYALRLRRESETHVAILGCFAIGLGGGLTPIAGPIPAITMAKLSDASYEVGTRYLFDLLGAWVVPAVLTIGIAAGILFGELAEDREKPIPEDPLSLWSMLTLTGRMYVFIAGLVLLGSGLVPFIDRYILGAPPWLLYWVNWVSAVIDGATLASVEISPHMSQNQLRYILMGVLIAGGALVTGNAPNLIAAHKLKISVKEWMKIGVPVGGILMLAYFLSLKVWAG